MHRENKAKAESKPCAPDDTIVIDWGNSPGVAPASETAKPLMSENADKTLAESEEKRQQQK